MHNWPNFFEQRTGPSLIEEALQALVTTRCNKILEENKKLKAKLTELGAMAQVGRAFIHEQLKVGDVWIQGCFPLEHLDFLRAHKITAVQGTHVEYVSILHDQTGACRWSTIPLKCEARDLARRVRALPAEIEAEIERRNKVALQPVSKAKRRARAKLYGWE